MNPYTVFAVYEDDDTDDPWYLGHVMAATPTAAARAALQEAHDNGDGGMIVYAVIAGHHKTLLEEVTGIYLESDTLNLTNGLGNPVDG